MHPQSHFRMPPEEEGNGRTRHALGPSARPVDTSDTEGLEAPAEAISILHYPTRYGDLKAGVAGFGLESGRKKKEEGKTWIWAHQALDGC
ncbi:hypothetical protein NDU88_003003 [Pleurodeles waltl]|uniref:Uncharacterized protein n=1 Tax=Pleurodeles waltl TaxID=8319 RepID=A0AAV7MXA6_PLEWA|nr:hypothetical protein NDU88_003003 [Pleurodeles waltl]